jgi:hypothetical protein
MNLDDLQRRFITAARRHPPSEAVPYAFEKRIMARLRGLRPVDYWAFWAKGLWRAAAPCVVLTILLTAWSLLSTPRVSSNVDLAQEFENTVLAAVDADQPPPDSLR